MRPWVMISSRVTSPENVYRYITGVTTQRFTVKEEIHNSAPYWKITCSVFYENRESYPCGYPGTGHTIYSVHYVETIKMLKARTARGRKKTKIFSSE
jgi:hypothetical protein